MVYLGVSVEGVEFIFCSIFMVMFYVIVFMGCIGVVGDVKMLVFSFEEFIVENGVCWELMSG